MARIDVRTDVSLSAPTLIEGFPGVGLVGKIAADHLVSTLGMTHYADVHCESLPKAATFATGRRGLGTPVRLYADAERDLLVLQSDVPVSPAAATEFAECVDGWFREESVLPIYVAGLRGDSPAVPTGETEVGGEEGGEHGDGEHGDGGADGADGAEAEPSVFGVGSGDGESLLAEANVPEPTENGIVSGPTGALLNHALATELTAVGLFAECDPRFPDPRAARAVLERGVAPITELDVPTDDLEDRAAQIQRAKDRLAQQMRDEEEENASQALALRMYQ